MKRTVVSVTRGVTSDADKRDEMEKWRRAKVCGRASASVFKEKHLAEHIGFSLLKPKSPARITQNHLALEPKCCRK